MKICISYRGLSYMEKFVNHHGVCTFSMMSVVENHFKYIVEPLRSNGHDVVFALSTNESPILQDLINIFQPVYVSVDGSDQMDRSRDMLNNVTDVTHFILLRCDLKMKCFITEIPIQWDRMNFPWLNFDRKFARNGDVIFAFPMTIKKHVSESFHQLHTYFRMKGEIPHGHGLFKRFFQNKSIPYTTMVSDMYNSNTDVTQNPIFTLARSFDINVPLHSKVKKSINVIDRHKNFQVKLFQYLRLANASAFFKYEGSSNGKNFKTLP